MEKQKEDRLAILQFLGGVGTVTGSKYLLKVFGKTILIDCGLFQGEKKLRLLNWDSDQFFPTEIDHILLTHGHLDHCGYLPRAVKKGFRGKIFGTKPTLDVANIVLKDSAKLQEEDAELANAGGYSKHKPAFPLYDSEDAEKTIKLFQAVEIGEWFELEPNIRFRFRYNGHILGASFIELKVGNKTLIFSGDIGRDEDALLFAPEKPEEGDIILIESTYGNRIHRGNPIKRLAQLIHEFSTSKGTIIIPCFAVERIQAVMYLIWKLMKEGEIPNIPVYMDSPMGSKVLDLFNVYGSEWHKLKEEELAELKEDIFCITESSETKKIANKRGPKIVIAGSGMATGGRVLSYLEHSLGDPNSLVLFVGYQAKETRGNKLLRGDTEIKIRGKYHQVRCDVQNIDGLSAHADQTELINWLSKIKTPPKEVFIVHGEEDASRILGNRIRNVYGWETRIPERGEVFEFEV
ncbi:MBL fold metallo-hydrolase RNA specificity domain-containing protein [Leptospira andrefontaineae]|uniref:MBL fold metallo-hydrolase n=1 Tax=Leptospira andrefontaineae TaxID=2484976 RepID=A0A4V3JFS7_9LEPT|nr:MBL fold metallo-hydrolase [Leptospira andrefontaineae]TGK38750.1 MBL fold metallo-hydrolase [Leptospira andrefontaineae]